MSEFKPLETLEASPMDSLLALRRSPYDIHCGLLYKLTEGRLSRRDLLTFSMGVGAAGALWGPLARAAARFDVEADRSRARIIIGGVSAFEVSADRFDGEPVVNCRRTNREFSIQLSNGYIPGTRVPAEFELSGENSAGEWEGRFCWPALAFQATFSLEHWLLGRPVARGHMNLSRLLASLQSGAFDQPAPSEGTFFPSWIVSFDSWGGKYLKTAAGVVEARGLQLEILGPDGAPIVLPRSGRAITRLWTSGLVSRPTQVVTDAGHATLGTGAVETLVEMHRDIRSEMRDAVVLETSADSGAGRVVPPFSPEPSDEHFRATRMRVALAAGEPAAVDAHFDNSSCWYQRGSLNVEITAIGGTFNSCPNPSRPGDSGHFCVSRLIAPVPGADNAVFVRRECKLSGDGRSIDASKVRRSDAVDGMQWFDSRRTSRVQVDEFDLRLSRGSNALCASIAFRDIDLEVKSDRASLQGRSSAPFLEFCLGSQHAAEEAMYVTDAVTPALRVAKARFAGPTWLTFQLKADRRGNREIPLSVEELFNWERKHDGGGQRLELQLHPLAVAPDKSLNDQLTLYSEANLPPQRLGDDANANGRKLATLIQAPYRLGMSPVGDQHWQVRGLTAASKGVLPELWSVRTEHIKMRAVWSPDYDGGFWANTLCHVNTPFRGSLDARDRHEIVALTARFGVPALMGSAQVVPDPRNGADPDTGIFVPQPVRADMVLLSSFGATLRIHGRWAPPAAPKKLTGALTVQSWDQASQLGRDSKVVVEYKGFLFPIGHPAILVKETERRLVYEPTVGVVARLVQRYFIRVAALTRQLPALEQPFDGRGWPFGNVTMPAFVSPDLEDPGGSEVIDKRGQQAFWPRVAGTRVWVDFPFRDTSTGVEATAPMLFLDNDIVHQAAWLLQIVRHYRNELEKARNTTSESDPAKYHSILNDDDHGLPRRYVARITSGKIRFALSNRPDKTSFKVSSLLLDVDIPQPGASQTRAADLQIGPAPACRAETTKPNYNPVPAGGEIVQKVGAGDTLTLEEADAAQNADILQALQITPSLEGQNQPPFYPHLRQGLVEAAQIAVLTGGTRQAALVEIDSLYLRRGFNSENSGKIYLRFVDSNAHMAFSGNTSGCGGFANTSTIFNAASEIRGPIGGSFPPVPQRPGYRYEPPAKVQSLFAIAGQSAQSDDPVAKARAGQADPREFFGNSLGDAKLCGVVSFVDIVEAVLKATGSRAPQIIQQVEHAVTSSVVRPLAKALLQVLTDSKLTQQLNGIAYLHGPVQKVIDQLVRASNANDADLVSIGTDLVNAVKDLRDKVNAAIEDPKVLLPPEALQIIDLVLKVRTALEDLSDPDKRRTLVTKFLNDMTDAVREQAISQIEGVLAAHPEFAIFLQRLRDLQGAVDNVRRDLQDAPQAILTTLPSRLLAIFEAAVGARAWSLWLDNSLAKLQTEAVAYAVILKTALQDSEAAVEAASNDLKKSADQLKHTLDATLQNLPAATDEKTRKDIQQAFLEISDISLSAAGHAADLKIALGKVTTFGTDAKANQAAAAKLFPIVGSILDSVAKAPRLAVLQKRLEDQHLLPNTGVILAYATWADAAAGDTLLTIFKGIQQSLAIAQAAVQAASSEAEALDEYAQRVTAALNAANDTKSKLQNVIQRGARLDTLPQDYADVSEAITIIAAALGADEVLRQAVRRAQLAARSTVVRILLDACGQLARLMSGLKSVVDPTQSMTANSAQAAARWLSPSLRARLATLSADLSIAATGPTNESEIAPYLRRLDAFTDDAAKLIVELGRIASTGDIASLVNVREALDKVLDEIGIPTSVSTSYDWETEVNEYPGGAGAVFIPHGSKTLAIHSLASVNLRTGGPPNASVVATLDRFSIKLLGSTPFLTINFEPLSFSAGTGRSASLTANVSSVEFEGELKFVKTLQEWLKEKTGITVDPWKEGPGIVVGYQFNHDKITCAAFTIQNIGFNIAAILPFNSERARFRFGLSTAERPFLLSAGIYGGGGFVAIQSRADTIEYIEASFEYGLVTAFQFGPATGSGRITAGVYIRLGGRQAKVGGFFNASGNADIAGLISVSANFRVIIWYEFTTGRVAGEATFSISFTIGFVSFSYSIDVAYARQGDGGGSSNSEQSQSSSLTSPILDSSLLFANNTPMALPAPSGDAQTELDKRKKEIAERIEPDNFKGREPDISHELLKPALWNQYWNAFEESIDECV
jgi:hypothetical protein